MGWGRYSDYGGYGYGFRPYVSVAQRRANAAREVAKLQKKGRTITPVKIDGLKIARTFWGNAWCDHMERYSDYANRLPRGRTYVRNGSVVDLQILPGRVTALVAGSELYEIDITIDRCTVARWKTIRTDCAGKIGSLIELLQGKLSAGVMEIIAGAKSGLFPAPGEIKLSCSCPDGAYLCKHVAAALYGVGARLDHQPELLFTLRQVDHLELIAQAGQVDQLIEGGAASQQKTLDEGALADVFGIEIEPLSHDQPANAGPSAPTTRKAPSGRRSASTPKPRGGKRPARSKAPPTRARKAEKTVQRRAVKAKAASRTTRA